MEGKRLLNTFTPSQPVTVSDRSSLFFPPLADNDLVGCKNSVLSTPRCFYLSPCDEVLFPFGIPLHFMALYCEISADVLDFRFDLKHHERHCLVFFNFVLQPVFFSLSQNETSSSFVPHKLPYRDKTCTNNSKNNAACLNWCTKGLSLSLPVVLGCLSPSEVILSKPPH